LKSLLVTVTIISPAFVAHSSLGVLLLARKEPICWSSLWRVGFLLSRFGFRLMNRVGSAVLVDFVSLSLPFISFDWLAHHHCVLAFYFRALGFRLMNCWTSAVLVYESVIPSLHLFRLLGVSTLVLDDSIVSRSLLLVRLWFFCRSDFDRVTLALWTLSYFTLDVSYWVNCTFNRAITSLSFEIGCPGTSSTLVLWECFGRSDVLSLAGLTLLFGTSFLADGRV
jgi:hypothetical protein